MSKIRKEDLFLPKEIKDPFDYSEVFLIERNYVRGEIFVPEDKLIE